MRKRLAASCGPGTCFRRHRFCAGEPDRHGPVLPPRRAARPRRHAPRRRRCTSPKSARTTSGAPRAAGHPPSGRPSRAGAAGRHDRRRRTGKPTLEWQYAATRRTSSRLGPARRRADDDRRHRHRRGPLVARPRRRRTPTPTASSRGRDRHRPERPRNIRRLARGRIGREGGLVRGFGGDARLMIVQANRHANDFTDANEAAAIVWAVDHGAQIVNLSLGGRDTSQVEQDAVAYAVDSRRPARRRGGERRGRTGTTPRTRLRSCASRPRRRRVDASRTRAPTSRPPRAYVALAAPGVDVLGALRRRRR